MGVGCKEGEELEQSREAGSEGRVFTAVLGYVRVSPSRVRSAQLRTVDWALGSWGDPEAATSCCPFLPCFTFIFSGFTVLTPHLPQLTVPQGTLEKSPQHSVQFSGVRSFCMHWELGWGLSPESIRTPAATRDHQERATGRRFMAEPGGASL